MLEVKLFEVRDKATLMPVMATRLVVVDDPELQGLPGIEKRHREAWLLRRAGYGFDYPCVMVTNLQSGDSSNDPFDWSTPARTIPRAHQHIVENWDFLKSGDVVDIEFILGEKPSPKTSEQYTTSY